jgi:small-conductance mechanosensitive channel
MPNANLTSSRLRNHKRMYERRIVTKIGVAYETPQAQLKALPDVIRSIISKESEVRLDRVHFMGFGNSSLDFEWVYFILDANYNLYMDIQQRINFAILDEFEKQGIDVAYPTRTVHLKESRPAAT